MTPLFPSGVIFLNTSLLQRLQYFPHRTIFLILSGNSLYRIQVFHLPSISPFQRKYPFPKFVSLLSIYYFGTRLSFLLYTSSLPHIFPSISLSTKSFVLQRISSYEYFFMPTFIFAPDKLSIDYCVRVLPTTIFLPAKVLPFLSIITIITKLLLFRVSPPLTQYFMPTKYLLCYEFSFLFI